MEKAKEMNNNVQASYGAFIEKYNAEKARLTDIKNFQGSDVTLRGSWGRICGSRTKFCRLTTKRARGKVGCGKTEYPKHHKKVSSGNLETFSISN